MGKRTIAVLLAVLMTTPIVAQIPDARTRAQRLKEHEERIKTIIEARRQEAAEKQQRDQAIDAANAAVDAARGAPEAAQEPQKAVSSVVMGFKFTNDKGESAYNIIVNEGDTFLSEVYLFNLDANPIEHVRLALDYDKRFITPLRVFDTTLRPRLKGEPLFADDKANGVLQYEGALTQPMRDQEVILLRVLWKAERATPFSGIDFHFDPLERADKPHTAILAQNMNILGTKDDPFDGVLSGGLMVDYPRGEPKRLQGKSEELRELYLGSIGSTESVGLELVGPVKPPKVGEDFIVRVRLNNDGGALIDALSMYITFDPQVLQVVDSDKFNYITRGVNINDGPYHVYFPWDMHKANEVLNERGSINYQMSLANGASLPSRTMATIRFRAMAPTAGTEIFFVKGESGAALNTSVRYFGYELLDEKGKKSTSGLRIPVLAAPLQVAEQPREQDSPAPARPVAQGTPPVESNVKPLLIER